MKECREAECPFCFCQAAGEDCLQHNAANQPDESKSLADADEQFRAIEILRCPSRGVLRTQPAGKGRTSESSGKQQAWIGFAREQKCGDESNWKKWKRAPDNRGTNLVGFEAANSQRLRNKNNGCTKREAKPEEQAAKQYGVPLPKIRKRHQRIRSTQSAYKRTQEKKRSRPEPRVEYSGAPPIKPLALLKCSKHQS